MPPLTGDILIVDDERVDARVPGHLPQAQRPPGRSRRQRRGRPQGHGRARVRRGHHRSEDARRQRAGRAGRIQAPAPRHPGDRGDRLRHRRDRHRRHEGRRLRLPDQALQGGRGGAGGRTGARAPGAAEPERRPARRDQGPLQAGAADRQVAAHAAGVRGDPEDRPGPHQRAADRRIGHRQGAGRPGRARAVGARRTTPSSPSTAGPSPRP